MLHYYLKKMNSKDLSISHNITVSKNGVLFDGQLLYRNIEAQDFSAFSKDLYKKIDCNYPKFYKMDNICKLAFLAGELLVKRSELANIPPENISLIFANSGSTIDTDTKFIDSFEAIPSPAIFVYTLPNIAIGELCIRNGWKGEGMFLVQSLFNPQELIDHAGFAFQFGFAKICILGWIDFFSFDDFQACLWLVSDSFNKGGRLLSAHELSVDFNFQL
jgi:hypothetical protein